MLPAVLEWNAPSTASGRRRCPTPWARRAGRRRDLVRELMAGLDQPVTLRGVGIKRENLDEIARRSLGYQPVQLNPRPISSAADVKEILELAW